MEGGGSASGERSKREGAARRQSPAPQNSVSERDRGRGEGAGEASSLP